MARLVALMKTQKRLTFFTAGYQQGQSYFPFWLLHLGTVPAPDCPRD